MGPTRPNESDPQGVIALEFVKFLSGSHTLQTLRITTRTILF